KREPATAWELVAARGQGHGTSAPAAERAIGSTLVGREHELAMLDEAVRNVLGGRGGIAAVIGEAGIGKSRLLAELLASPALLDACVLEGRSVAVGQGLSFHPFIDLLRRWAGITPDDAPPDASAKLQ